MAYFADNFSALSLFSVSSVVKFFVFQPKRIHSRQLGPQGATGNHFSPQSQVARWRGVNCVSLVCFILIE